MMFNFVSLTLYRSIGHNLVHNVLFITADPVGWLSSVQSFASFHDLKTFEKKIEIMYLAACKAALKNYQLELEF